MRAYLSMWALCFYLLVSSMPAAHACASIAKRQHFVRIADETAIIVWDEATHTEHFIRTADARTDGHDFGFIVPTPAPPKLAAANVDALNVLADEIQPKVLTGDQYMLDTASALTAFAYVMHSLVASKHVTRSARGSVRILNQQRVAGLDAVTLSAADTKSLGAWLTKNGYNWDPSLAGWLKPYIAEKWVVNAFKVSADAKAGAASTGLLSMTFRAEAPYFPYSEPSSERSSSAGHYPRLLRVYFVSKGRMKAAMGGGASWPGKITYAAPLKSAIEAKLTSNLPADTNLAEAGSYLSVFEDTSSPRPGYTDLYFSRDAETANIVPAPIDDTDTHLIVIPADILFFMGLFLSNRLAEGASLRNRRFLSAAAGAAIGSGLSVVVFMATFILTPAASETRLIWLNWMTGITLVIGCVFGAWQGLRRWGSI